MPINTDSDNPLDVSYKVIRQEGIAINIAKDHPSDRKLAFDSNDSSEPASKP